MILMKSKKMLLALLCTATVSLMATTAFAAQQSRALPAALTQTTETETGTERRFDQAPLELTEEQKAEMETRRAAMEAQRAAREEAWNNLTDAQKEELYVLQDAAIDAEIAVIDKQAALGLLTAEDATAMKESLEAKKAAIRESDSMPFMGGGRGHDQGQGGKMGGHSMRPPMSPDETVPDNTQI
jgi:hypothetical protein